MSFEWYLWFKVYSKSILSVKRESLKYWEASGCSHSLSKAISCTIPHTEIQIKICLTKINIDGWDGIKNSCVIQFSANYARYNACFWLFIRREARLNTGLMSNNSDKIKLPERELKVFQWNVSTERQSKIKWERERKRERETEQTYILFKHWKHILQQKTPEKKGSHIFVGMKKKFGRF